MTDTAEYIRKYILLRDKEAEIKARHKEELAPFGKAKEALEAFFLAQLTQLGSDSLSNREHGTVYKVSKKSATVQDPAEFRRFVIGGEAWDLADIRANAPAIEGFMKEHNGQTPPGVKYSEFTTVGIRRS